MREIATDKSTLIAAVALALEDFNTNRCPTCGSTNMKYYHSAGGRIACGQCQDCGQIIGVDAAENLRIRIADAFTTRGAHTQEVMMKVFEVDNSLLVAEDFNAESTHIEHNLAQEGVEYNHDGTLIQVDTPWAMGFVDKQGVLLS